MWKEENRFLHGKALLLFDFEVILRNPKTAEGNRLGKKNKSVSLGGKGAKVPLLP